MGRRPAEDTKMSMGCTAFDAGEEEWEIYAVAGRWFSMHRCPHDGSTVRESDGTRAK